MKISYAITVCNEIEEITRLLNFLIKAKRKEDEIVVLFDKKNGTPEVWQRVSELKGDPCCTYYSKTFKHHFADWPRGQVPAVELRSGNEKACRHS